MPQPANEHIPRRPDTPEPVPGLTSPPPARPAPDPIVALIEFFASRPGCVRTILAQHRNDGTGHCTLCTAGGQAGRMVWPCRIHGAAATADASRAADRNRVDFGPADNTRGPHQ